MPRLSRHRRAEATAPADTGTRWFTVDITDSAAPVVTVDGRVQHDVAHVAVEARPGEPAHLHLVFTAAGQFDGEGYVHVVEPSPRAIAAWLDSVNPSALEQAAANLDHGIGGPLPPGRAFLAALRAILGEVE